MDELPFATRLVVRVRSIEGPVAFPEIELAGTREGLEWLAGQLLAVARAEAARHAHLGEFADEAVIPLPGSWGLRIARHKGHGPQPDVLLPAPATDEATADRPVYGHCAVCGAVIRWGEPVVTVSRANELVTSSGHSEVLDGAELASLCAVCGPHYPAESIRVVFSDPLRPAEPNAAPDRCR